MNYWLLFSGILLAVVAVLLFIGDSIRNKSEIKELEKANAQTETLIEELSELSFIITNEMDKKYNDMIGIYEELLGIAEPIQKGPQRGENQKFIPEDTQPQNKKNAILDLYNTGKPLREIAQELGIGMGEVELVIKFAHAYRGS